ncbi:MAG: hypothetical protein AB2L11_00410 [Syntrophobacteraceae bacterium]
MKICFSSIVLIIGFFLLGCSAGVKRQGYTALTERVPSDCEVVVLGYEAFDDTRMERLGNIEMYDTGFSLYCDEAYVLDLMKKEACSLGADIVNITDEKYPDFWSSCYRAKAEFIRLKNREEAALVKADPHYDDMKVRERSQETWRRLQDAIEGGIMGGIMGPLAIPPH